MIIYLLNHFKKNHNIKIKLNLKTMEILNPIKYFSKYVFNLILLSFSLYYIIFIILLK